MNLYQILTQPVAAAAAATPEIGPADILAVTTTAADGRPRCPRCGKGIYLEVERRDAGIIPHATRDDDLEFDPDDSDGGDATIISAYCACGWAYPDAPAALFATTIGYAPVLAWETGKDSLREMLTDVAYAQWEKAHPDAAAQHADTYQAHVTPTPSGYRVTLLALEWEVATPESTVPSVCFYVTPGADPNYPLDVWECRDEAATLLDRSKEDWGVLREDYPGITRATRADDFIVAPAGQRYRCTGE